MKGIPRVSWAGAPRAGRSISTSLHLRRPIEAEPLCLCRVNKSDAESDWGNFTLSLCSSLGTNDFGSKISH